MKLISWNVNGIRAVSKKGFSDWLKKAKPDLLGLQEIKISNEARLKETFSAQGGPALGWDFDHYEEYWHPAKRPGYSGTAILSKIPTKIANGFGSQEFSDPDGSLPAGGQGALGGDEEGRVQIADLAKFYFINVYFPNANSDLSRLDYKLAFNKALLKHLKDLEKIKPIVICGDFNVAHQEIDLARPKENVGNPGFTFEERAWADELAQAGFVDTYRYLHPDQVEYSWWSYRAGARDRNVGWRIDYFWVSQKLAPKIKRAWIETEVYGSDHAPIGLELDI